MIGRVRRLRYVTLISRFGLGIRNLGNQKVPKCTCSASTYFLEFTHVPLFIWGCKISRVALYAGADSVRDAEDAGVKSRHLCVKDAHENSSR